MEVKRHVNPRVHGSKGGWKKEAIGDQGKSLQFSNLAKETRLEEFYSMFCMLIICSCDKYDEWNASVFNFF